VLNISFAWWNTSLSPSAKPKANDAERQIAIAVIRFLLSTGQKMQSPKEILESAGKI
jgi:hypothetical protein